MGIEWPPRASSTKMATETRHNTKSSISRLPISHASICGLVLSCFLASLLACLLPCLRACFLDSFLPSFLACLLACFHPSLLSSLLPCLLACLVACFLASFRASFLACSQWHKIGSPQFEQQYDMRPLLLPGCFSPLKCTPRLFGPKRLQITNGRCALPSKQNQMLPSFLAMGNVSCFETSSTRTVFVPLPISRVFVTEKKSSQTNKKKERREAKIPARPMPIHLPTLFPPSCKTPAPACTCTICLASVRRLSMVRRNAITHPVSPPSPEPRKDLKRKRS